MQNLFSYFFFNLSNLLLILLISESNISTFLIFYSLANGLFTFVIFFNFSTKFYLTPKIMILVGFIVLIISNFEKLYFMIIFGYVLLLLFCDYLFSQSNLNKTNLVLKILLFFTSAILFLPINLITIIQIKILLIIIFLIYYIANSKSSKKLKVKSPLLYIALISVIYNGSLFLISILFNEQNVKVYYIFTQVLLGIKLRFYDLKIRDIFNISKKFYYFFDIIGISFALIISLYFNDYLFATIFIFCLILLNYVKYKYIY